MLHGIILILKFYINKISFIYIMDYKEKYLKYKNKYLQLKNQIGSAQVPTVDEILNDKSDPRRFLYIYLESKCDNEENINKIRNYLDNNRGYFHIKMIYWLILILF